MVVVKTVPLSWLITDTPGVCNLVIKTLAADHYYLIWTLWKPRKRVSNRMIRGRLVGRGFVTVLDDTNTIGQNEFGNTTTHTFDLLSIPPSTTFWYVLADHFASEVATYVTPPVQSVTCAAPSITKSVQPRRNAAFGVNSTTEVSIPFDAEDFDDYDGWPCAGAVRRVCVDDLSLWISTIGYHLKNRGPARDIILRVRTAPDDLIVWQETIPFGTDEVKDIVREIDYIPAAGSLSVLFTIQKPVLGLGMGWTLSGDGVHSAVYHRNNV